MDGKSPEREVERFRSEKIAVLWGDMADADFLGLIVPMETGVIWSNQTGGTMCNHPKVEGIYVPLPTYWLKANPIENAHNLSEPFAVEENARIVERFMRENPEVGQRFEVDRESVARAQEAWLPVRVKDGRMEERSWDVLAPFYGMSGILTYPNSD